MARIEVPVKCPRLEQNNPHEFWSFTMPAYFTMLKSSILLTKQRPMHGLPLKLGGA